jgi:hypothetical protein
VGPGPVSAVMLNDVIVNLARLQPGQVTEIAPGRQAWRKVGGGFQQTLNSFAPQTTFLIPFQVGTISRADLPQLSR